MTTYCLYWIHYPDQTNPESEGYIGITSDFSKRIKTHSKYTKYAHIKNRIDSGAIATVLQENLTKEQAEFLEASYRPEENIGWNIAKGGNIPPSRTGKVSPKALLTGNDRTENQQAATKKLAEANRNNKKPRYNATPVVLFGKTYRTRTEAMIDLGWSTSHYYKYKELVASGLTFDTPEQLKEYTYKMRNEKISKTRKERGYHYNQYKNNDYSNY
jgi:predicted GIY-YIG superfamily endonuclease